MLSATLSVMALLALVAIISTMFAQHWARFRAALLGQQAAHSAPLAPPAETNVVMLRPPVRQPAFSQPHLAQAA